MSTLRGCTAPLLPSVIVVLAALLLAACSGMPLVARESRSNAFDAAVAARIRNGTASSRSPAARRLWAMIPAYSSTSPKLSRRN